MPRDGTLEIVGTISGDLTPVGEIEGELTPTREVTGTLSAPKDREVPGDYEPLRNHPYINDEEVIGHKTFEDYGDHTLSNIEIKAIFDRVFNGGN